MSTAERIALRGHLSPSPSAAQVIALRGLLEDLVPAFVRRLAGTVWIMRRLEADVER